MSESPRILTVSRLAALLREVVEDNFFQVLVEGELSSFTAAASGHWYFCLKDADAQLRGVMFRPQNRLLPFRPENGMHVIAGGRLSIYPQRGEVQLIVESLTPQGVGGLQLAFEQCKARLAAEGLFAAERKRPLPSFPRRVGVVTSAHGAAIHDFLQVLRRRHAGVQVLLRPAKVQGEGAAEEIAEAIADLNRYGDVDVLVVGRGGGSLEDLWAFNEEIVARAIHASAIPVISAVGHEVDYTIADFVADLRAPTPSAAAEMVIKSRLELENHLDHLALRLGLRLRGELRLLAERVESLGRRLLSPRQEVRRCRQRQEELAQRLQGAMERRLDAARGNLAALAGRLDLLSPLRTLERGYAIAFAEKSGRAVRRGDELVAGDRLHLRFAEGSARAVVETVDPAVAKKLDSPGSGRNN